jgi:integrase
MTLKRPSSADHEPSPAFATSAGTPFNARNVQDYFKAAIKKAGVPSIRFHDMRHTHGSLLLEHGADPLAVADRLGHSLQTLMTRYRHILDKRKDRAAGVARSIFGVSNGN